MHDPGGDAERDDEVCSMLFLLVGLGDVTQDGHHERLDSGLVRATGDAEVPILSPRNAPAVRNDL